MKKVKQISLVLEAEEDFDEFNFIYKFKEFIENVTGIELQATHSKILKPFNRYE